jgi:hypothetical protein
VNGGEGTRISAFCSHFAFIGVRSRFQKRLLSNVAYLLIGYPLKLGLRRGGEEETRRRRSPKEETAMSIRRVS